MECYEWIELKKGVGKSYEEVRRRAGIELELTSRVDQRVLRWFGHVESIDEFRMARRELMAEVSGGRVRGRPRLGWMDGVKVALGNRGMTGGCTSMRERSEREESPGTYVSEQVARDHFCLVLCSYGPPSCALVIITWRGVGCRYMMRLGQTAKGRQLLKINAHICQVYGLRGLC